MTHDLSPGQTTITVTTWSHRRAPLAGALAATALVSSLLLAFGALAQQDKRLRTETAAAVTAEAGLPRPGEMRMNLKLNGRDIAFIGPMDPLVRDVVPFPDGEYTMGQDTREAAARIHARLGDGTKGKSLIVVAYHADETLAYRRARAIRGELIERFQMDPGAILASGRVASEHTGGATILDLYAVNPASCVDCSVKTFKMTAYDSGTVKLVTMIPEILKDQTAQAAPSKEATAPRPGRQQAVIAGAPEPAKAGPRTHKVALIQHNEAAVSDKGGKDYVSPAVVKRLQQSPLAVAGGGCKRPRVIIDDYYPGGPIVPCLASIHR